MEIIPVGTKIRELRKSLNLKQDELIKKSPTSDRDKAFTRNLVSMVETGKAKLTDKFANIIRYNIEQVIKDREIEVDFGELFKSEEEQVIEYLSFILKENNYDIVEASASELILALEKYKLYGELCVFYNRLGKLAIDNRVKAYNYYIKAFALKNELKTEIEYFKLINDLKYCSIRIGNYEESLMYTYPIEDISYDETEIETQVYHYIFNNILAYKKLGQYKETYPLLDKIKELSKDPEILILEAVIHSAANNYTKSIELYNKLLKKHEVTDAQRALIYNNIIEINIEVFNDNEKYLKELEKLIDSNEKISIDYLLTMARAYSGDLKIECLKKAVEISISLTVNMDNVIERFIENEIISEIHTEIMSGISLGLISPKVMLKLVKYYMDTDVKVAEQILKKAI